MLNIEVLHNSAMRFADEGLIAKRNGDTDLAIRHYRKAMLYERQAANILYADLTQEPSRSILFRSAGSLAMLCNDYKEAARLAASGLAGYPPDELADELRDVYDNASFYDHLDIRGTQLSIGEIRMMMTGSSVGNGAIVSTAFTDRLDKVTKLVGRIADDKQKRPFAQNNRISSADLVPVIFAPQPGCFAVVIKLGISRVSQQLSFPQADFGTEIINELMERLILFSEDKLDALKARVSKVEYYNNFVTLASHIAPDGDSVKAIAFSSINVTTKKPSHVSLHRAVRDKISSIIMPIQPDPVILEKPPKKTVLVGTLLLADGINKQSITLIDDNKKSYSISVPIHLLDDVVKEKWGQRVTVWVEDRRKGKERYLLIDIEEQTQPLKS